MTNYICINGKKAELTEEQMKTLGIELPKKPSPFDRRISANNKYYTIDSTGEIFSTNDMHHSVDIMRYRIANYCTDASILEQRALHETLNRLLWRYSMEHDGDKINWSNVSDKWTIYYEHDTHKYNTASWQTVNYLGLIFFNTRKTAESAIKEVIEPFMAAYPDFKW